MKPIPKKYSLPKASAELRESKTRFPSISTDSNRSGLTGRKLKKRKSNNKDIEGALESGDDYKDKAKSKKRYDNIKKVKKELDKNITVEPVKGDEKLGKDDPEYDSIKDSIVPTVDDLKKQGKRINDYKNNMKSYLD